jgi:hypothetical protein
MLKITFLPSNDFIRIDKTNDHNPFYDKSQLFYHITVNEQDVYWKRSLKDIQTNIKIVKYKNQAILYKQSSIGTYNGELFSIISKLSLCNNQIKYNHHIPFVKL